MYADGNILQDNKDKLRYLNISKHLKNNFKYTIYIGNIQ